NATARGSARIGPADNPRMSVIVRAGSPPPPASGDPARKSSTAKGNRTTSVDATIVTVRRRTAPAVVFFVPAQSAAITMPAPAKNTIDHGASDVATASDAIPAATVRQFPPGATPDARASGIRSAGANASKTRSGKRPPPNAPSIRGDA